MKTKKKLLIIVPCILLIVGFICFSISKNNSSKIPNYPIVMYDSHRFVFVGQTVSLDSDELELLGQIKKAPSKIKLSY